MKKSVCELTSDTDSANAELSAVVEYLDMLKDVCVAKTMTCEEKSQRRAAQIAGFREALFILSESVLLQRPQILQRVTIHQHETMSSNIASVKDAVEDVAAKIASTSADTAPLAGQNASSDSGLTAASAMRASGHSPHHRYSSFDA